MLSRQEILSVCRTTSVVIAILLYGCIACQSTLTSACGFEQNFHANETHYFDDTLYDIPVRVSVGSEYHSQYSFSKNTPGEWSVHPGMVAIVYGNRITSYVSYAADRTIGFGRTDIIFPFHYFL